MMKTNQKRKSYIRDDSIFCLLSIHGAVDDRVDHGITHREPKDDQIHVLDINELMNEICKIGQ